MRLRWFSLLCAVLLALAAASSAHRMSNEDLKRQVVDTERAFAATMQARDHEAFTRYLADEAIFFGARGEVLRGKEAIAQAWKGLFIQPQAPFSWAPGQVEVVDSGTLAYSGGEIRDPQGRVIGRFNSIWRLESPGRWKIVFDRGSDFVKAAAP